VVTKTLPTAPETVATVDGNTITFTRDDKYAHLFRPACTCGWDKSGLVQAWLAQQYGDKHGVDHMTRRNPR
jgi:hypothetical protein